jgi:hypothetical protein
MKADELKVLLYRAYALGYESGTHGSTYDMDHHWQSQKYFFEKDIEKATGWISVKDRLPEKDGEYLTYCNDSKNGNIDVDPFFDDCYPYGVTHWQPLPAPPGTGDR